VDMAPNPGDVAERVIPIVIPARIGEGPGSVDVPEVSARMRLRLIRAAEDDSGEHVNTVALIRGAGMVVDYWPPGRKPLAGGGYRAVLEVGQALDGVPGFDPESNRALEAFLRASEPPAHNKWDPHTPRLKSQYRAGAVGRIRELWKDVTAAIIEMCEQKPPSDADGPDRLKALFPLGRVGPPAARRFRVDYDYSRSSFDRHTNEWWLAASVHRLSRDGEVPWVVSISVALEGDSGRGSKVDIVDVELPMGTDSEATLDAGKCILRVPGNADTSTFKVRAVVPDGQTITRRARARLLATVHDEAATL